MVIKGFLDLIIILFPFRPFGLVRSDSHRMMVAGEKKKGFWLHCAAQNIFLFLVPSVGRAVTAMWCR